MGMGAEELGASSCSLATPSTRKRVRFGGNVGSLPNSSSTLNHTCFFGFSSAYVGGIISLCPAPRFMGSGLQVETFHGAAELLISRIGSLGLGEGDQCQLGHWGEGLWHHLDLSLPLKWECHLLELNLPAEVYSLSHLADSAPNAQLRQIKSVKWNNHGSISSSSTRLSWPSFIL